MMRAKSDMGQPGPRSIRDHKIMKVAKDLVVQFLYTLFDGDQEVESSRGGEPMAYLHGHGNIIPGLEEAMLDREAGDHFRVTVPPEKAYGEYQEGLTQRVPVKHLQGAAKWQPGMVAVVNTERGQRQVRIAKVGRFMATVDLNHPFAGRELTFEVDVVKIREA